MPEVWYCTRENVQDTLALTDSARLNRRIDRAIGNGARHIEGFLHRKFYPSYGTRTFDMPTGQTLWLYDHELAAAPDAVVSGGVAMASTDYILQPESGPPYRWIDQNLAGTVFWASGQTTQRSISITGVQGYPCTMTTATTITAGITAGATSMSIADSSMVGVGQLVQLDNERIIVTERGTASTTATLSGALGASKAETVLTVSNPALLNQGERILIDGEWMFIETIAGSSVIVTRAANGTVLAAHSGGALIYAPRVLTVARGQLGTTAASHLSAAPVVNVLAPSQVIEANIALALDEINQQTGGYSSSWGSGSRAGQALGANKVEAGGAGIEGLMERLYSSYGRKARSRVVGS